LLIRFGANACQVANPPEAATSGSVQTLGFGRTACLLLKNALTYTQMNPQNSPSPDLAASQFAVSPASRPVSLQELRYVGEGLVRPECVLANAAGDLFTADWRGGVAHRRADGGQTLYAGTGPDGLALKPNGIALMRDGSFLLAHLGAEQGGIYQLWRDGRVAPWLLRVDGIDLPPTNFVVEDAQGRFWVTVSTRLKPRALGYRRSCNDGFIVRVDSRGAAIVADGLGYTNEVAIHPNGQWLYVNETFARRLSRFPQSGLKRPIRLTWIGWSVLSSPARWTARIWMVSPARACATYPALPLPVMTVAQRCSAACWVIASQPCACRSPASDPRTGTTHDHSKTPGNKLAGG
jgi:hypothetical protein